MKYTEALQMRKTADGGVINDALGNAITVGATMPLGGIGGLASLGGTIAGLAAGPAKEKDLNKMDKRPAYSYIPGVGAYRLARKQLAAVDNSRPRSTLLSEMAGPLTSSVAPALVGAGLGAAFGGQPGAAIGALAGGAASGGATLLGNLIGMARRRRTDMERGIEDEEESRLANLLVPGVAGYRTGRRALDAYDDEVKRNEFNEEARQYAGRELVADMLRAQGNSVYTFGGHGNDGPVLSYRPSSASAPAEESGDKETSDESGKTGTTASKGASEKSDNKEKTDEQDKEASLRKQAGPATYQEYYDAYMNDPARVKERNSLNFIRPMSLMTLGAIRGAKVGMHYDRANIPKLQLAKNLGNQPSLISEIKGTLGGTAIGGGLGLSIGLLLNAAKRNSKAVKDSEAAGQYAYNRMLETRQARTQEAPKPEKPEADGTKEDKEQKKEAALRMYSTALQMRKQAETAGTPTPYSNAKNMTDGVLSGMTQRPYAVHRIAQDIAEPVVGRLAELQEKRDQIQRDRFYGGLTAGLGVGGLTAAGTYGLTGLVPGLKNSKFLRWLLAGTAGGVAGLQAGRLGADASNVQHLA